MDELAQQLKIVLADTITFYQKTHQFHWNVEGGDFYMLHLLFERIYQEVYGSVDEIGEQLRALDSVAPYGHNRLSELTTITDTDEKLNGTDMIRVLLVDNSKVLSSLMNAYRMAERFSEIGLSNFLQDRYKAHKVHQYFLRSSLRGEEA